MIKKNASYVVEKEYAHSKVIRFGNGTTLRLVSLQIYGERRDHLTDIMDLSDIYIHWIYLQRWNIEVFFRTMKSYLRIDHLISRKINGIMVQIFSALIAYLVLLIIQSSLSISNGIPQMIRMIRHRVPLPVKQVSEMAASLPGI
jgi:IS4 transposase